MKYIILASRGDESDVINEEKTHWVNSTLISLGVDKKIIEDIEEIDRIDYMQYLQGLDFDVYDNYDGTVDIHKGEKIVAKWNKPTFTLVKEDGNLYYEIEIDVWQSDTY